LPRGPPLRAQLFLCRCVRKGARGNFRPAALQRARARKITAMGCGKMEPSTAKPGKRNAARFLSKVIDWIGYVSLSGMVMATAINVCGRYILKKPLLGEVDLVELGMSVFGGVAMYIAAIERHHIGVDVVLVRFSSRVRNLMNRFAALLGFLTLGIMAYAVFLDGLDTLKNGDVTETLSIPQGPFEILFAIFLFLFCFALCVQIFKLEASGEKEEVGGPI